MVRSLCRAPSGPSHRKAFEEKRKRSFEDGGGPKKKKVERDEPRGNRFNYGGDDDD